jgi:SAM-dependent methyltransferase
MSMRKGPALFGRRHTLGRIYGALIEASREEYGSVHDGRLQRYFNNLTNFEYAETIREWLANAGRVLVIGDAGGRDTSSLRAMGKSVFSLDIAPQLDTRRLVIADAAEGLPFDNETFDGVVLAEVIEHLYDDVRALREIRRVLAPEGRLALTTPIGNDAPEYHVRVYTPVTMRRLLQHTGFDTAELLVKGGGFAALDGTFVGASMKHACQLLSWRLTGRTHYRQWNGALRRADLAFARFAPFVHRASRHYGMFVLAVRRESDSVPDLRAMNVGDFAYRV